MVGLAAEVETGFGGDDELVIESVGNEAGNCRSPGTLLFDDEAGG
jgi:hypothetical protein